MSENTLWVGNLHDRVTEDILYELFLQCGPVVRVNIHTNKSNVRMAFITFKHIESIPYTIEMMSGLRLFGTSLSLNAYGGKANRSNSFNNRGDSSFDQSNSFRQPLPFDSPGRGGRGPSFGTPRMPGVSPHSPRDFRGSPSYHPDYRTPSPYEHHQPRHFSDGPPHRRPQNDYHHDDRQSRNYQYDDRQSRNYQHDDRQRHDYNHHSRPDMRSHSLDSNYSRSYRGNDRLNHSDDFSRGSGSSRGDRSFHEDAPSHSSRGFKRSHDDRRTHEPYEEDGEFKRSRRDRHEHSHKYF